MTLRLRAHHLLCMLTYTGKGYGDAFVREFDAVVRRIGAGEAIELIAGPDDVCAPIAGDPAEHCHCASVTRRDHLAAAALAPLLGMPLEPGARLSLTAALLQRLRTAFAQGGIRGACADCPWSAMCTGVAASGYGASLLRMAARG